MTSDSLKEGIICEATFYHKEALMMISGERGSRRIGECVSDLVSIDLISSSEV